MHLARGLRSPLRIAIGADRAGRRYASALTGELSAHPLVDYVLDLDTTERPPAYPEVAVAFAGAQLVAEGAADRALLVSHTGVDMAIAANKVSGVRAVNAHDPLAAKAAVEASDAQVLTLGQGHIGLDVARHVVAAWVTFQFDSSAPAAAGVAVITGYENRIARPVAFR
ncbi:RpiB/LacA/LacB family sugar-phosphate isomerase [Streptomyces sp. NPDC048636]|uniref:RpiB/LacA/LacB family sugar-phosphate isomerase n=1 Tax=Streptomyces sp. NPDC048636 TaxID=3155762 RepID=UPI003434D9DB